MTEAEWRTSKDPAPLLTYLQAHVSERKIRLLACACCRGIWEHLPDRSRQGVEVAERFVDGLASPKDLAKAHGNAVTFKGEAGWAAYWATSIRVAGSILNVFQKAAELPAKQAGQKTGKADTYVAVQAESMLEQADLVREVVGNPFRATWVSQAMLRWEGGLLAHLAEGIYQERAFDRMPYLGDALEEAGCADQEVLDHCRSGGPHVRGCWVLDLVLGKE
jgi:hypothetical protein